MPEQLQADSEKKVIQAMSALEQFSKNPTQEARSRFLELFNAGLGSKSFFREFASALGKNPILSDFTKNFRIREGNLNPDNIQDFLDDLKEKKPFLENPGAKLRISRTVPKIAERVSEDELIKRLGDADLDIRKRGEAAAQLGKNGGYRAVPALMEALSGKDEWLKGVAGDALVSLGGISGYHLAEALKDKSLRNDAMILLQRIGLPVISNLLPILNKPDEPRRMDAILVLERMGAPAVPYLIRAVQAGGPYLRRGAISALTGFNDQRAGPALSHALSDKDPQVRKLAAEAISGLESYPEVPRFVEGLRSADASERRAAARSLFELGDARAFRPMLGALKDQDATVRELAIKSFAYYGLEDHGKDIIPALISAMEDKEAGIRRIAARFLGLSRDEDAIPALIKAVEVDSDRGVKIAAADSLAMVGDYRAVKALRTMAKSEKKGPLHDAADKALQEISRR